MHPIAFFKRKELRFDRTSYLQGIDQIKRRPAHQKQNMTQTKSGSFHKFQTFHLTLCAGKEKKKLETQQIYRMQFPMKVSAFQELQTEN